MSQYQKKMLRSFIGMVNCSVDLKSIFIRNNRFANNWKVLLSKLDTSIQHQIECSYPEYLDTKDKIRSIIHGDYNRCPICNNIINWFSKSNKKTCSLKCSKILAKQTNIDRYGVNNALLQPHVIEKSKQSIEIFNNDISRKEAKSNKIKQTNLDRYGVECVFSNEEISNKIKQTNLDRYGVEVSLSSDVVRDKIKQTNLDRYGVEVSLSSDVVS